MYLLVGFGAWHNIKERKFNKAVVVALMVWLMCSSAWPVQHSGLGLKGIQYEAFYTRAKKQVGLIKIMRSSRHI